MDLLWPGFLVLLGLLPLFIVVYIWMLRRRRRDAVRYSSLTLVHQALPKSSRLRRHLPFALFLIALASLVMALSRPVTRVMVPTGRSTIILATDVSRSMCSTDVDPNRLEVAKDAALSFIRRQTASTQLGIVAFAGFAELIQTPTTDQEVLQDSVESLTTGRRTAIGSAILKSLEAIAAVNPNIPPIVMDPGSRDQPEPVPEGAYAPDIIVLLTDGANNTGPFPLDAAQQAVDRGIRIYTIGFGTPTGGVMDCGDQLWGGWFGGGGQLGGPFRRGIDEPTLRQIASMTGGEYHSASTADELHGVFQGLPMYLNTREEIMEISVAFTAAGALLAAMAVTLALIWRPLP
jgi:Ca-activated chloride channel family protein